MSTIITDVLHEAVVRFASVPPFADFIDPSRILVVATRGRHGPHGKRAEIHFTRFRESGAATSGDGRWRCPRIEMHGREIRYVIAFVFPRFLLLSPEEQGEDIVHELLHVDPIFDGRGSALRHGRRYDQRVRIIARRAHARGVRVPHLATEGETVYYRRLRPFPRPFAVSDPDARRSFDENDLEVAAMLLDPAARRPPPAPYLYLCPACGEQYPRRRPLAYASCGRCASGYDGRFRLQLVRSPRDRALDA